jgi:6-phosphogluconolactonase
MSFPRQALATAAVVIAALTFTQTVRAESVWVFLGTYTGGTSKGIYRCEFDTSTGKLTKPELVAETQDPSFLAIHPNKKFLYCVNEGSKGISAFALDARTGTLTPLNKASSEGGAPCHLVVDKDGKNVLAANYTGGSCCVCPIGSDGKLADKTFLMQHKEEGKTPHGHSINLDASGKLAFVADLGLDKVLVYKLDADKGTLTPHDPPAFQTARGAGPRHFAFHPSGKWAYVINETNSTLTAMSYDANKGVLKEINTLSTLPMEVKGNSTAEVVVHPSGKFVYGSNRGHNSIAVFTIDETTGKIAAAGHQGEGVKTPRNFNIDPTGQFMLVANHTGKSVIVFKIDPKTGALTPTGEKVELDQPVCVKFLAKP